MVVRYSFRWVGLHVLVVDYDVEIESIAKSRNRCDHLFGQVRPW